MRTARFVEVAPPLEARVTEGVFSRVRDALTFKALVQDRWNQTMHDEELQQRTAVSAVDALRPGSLAFGLMVLMLAVIIAKRVVIRRETNRILLDHGSPACAVLKDS